MDSALAVDLTQIVFVLGVLGFVALMIAIPIVISYFTDRSAHDGVDWFKRRAVLSRGQLADARVLSSEIVPGKNTGGSKYSAAYSIVYEVMPAGGAAFRKQAFEVMFFSEADANLSVDRIVKVRFDPTDQTVVLVRVSAKRAEQDAEAARRAKEERLLRGG